MADLITQADITARMGALNPSQAARVDALIADASALIRSECPALADATDEVVVLRSNAGKLRLPAVGSTTTVTSVELISWPTDLLLPEGTWLFDGIDTIAVDVDAAWVVNFPEAWTDDDGPGTYRVTYSHSWSATPADIVAVAANMVIRVLASPSMVEGLTGENIGQYGYQMSQAAGAAGAGVRITEADRRVLHQPKYRQVAGTVETPIR